MKIRNNNNKKKKWYKNIKNNEMIKLMKLNNANNKIK